MNQYTSNIKGECHCGNVRFEFETNINPNNLIIRNCQCRFCKLHGAATARDPKGSAKIFVNSTSIVKLYRFSTESTDFVLCANCGVYIGAVLTYRDSKYATLNMKLTELNTDNAVPIMYEDETLGFRIAKRAEIFTPVTDCPF
jgi:hypothetical protein